MNEHLELLGFEAKDKVTGFSGVITTLSYDLYGCIQYVITPKIIDGKRNEGAWFDANRLKITGKKRVMEVPEFTTGYVLDYPKGAANKPLP